MIWPRLWSGEETVISERHTLKPIPSKILLPIDFSPSSQAALETAATFALPFHAEPFLVNALPFFSSLRSEYAVPQVQFQQMEKKRAPSSSLRRRERFSQTAQARQLPVSKSRMTWRGAQPEMACVDITTMSNEPSTSMPVQRSSKPSWDWHPVEEARTGEQPS